MTNIKTIIVLLITVAIGVLGGIDGRAQAEVQYGSITGKVLDLTTQQPIVGALVVLEGTRFSAVTGGSADPGGSEIGCRRRCWK